MIRVMLVDDHGIVREGTRILLEKFPDMVVVAEAADGRSALEGAAGTSPNVVLMDMSMPGMNGIEATRRMSVEAPGAGVLILSMHDDKRFVAQAFRAGARGYLLKDCTTSELVEGVRAVASGQRYLCPGIVGVVIDDYASLVPDFLGQTGPALTAREREVLQLLAEGHNAKGIAYLLKINVKTVDTHRQQIMKKLNLFSVAELTKHAIREGVTSL